MIRNGAVFSAVLVLVAGTASAQDLPDGPGKDLVQTICTECHDTARIVAQRKTKAEWTAKVTEMLQEEQDVTEAEREIIINYLASHFAKADMPGKVNVNKASPKDLDPAKVEAKRELLEF